MDRHLLLLWTKYYWVVQMSLLQAINFCSQSVSTILGLKYCACASALYYYP